MNISVVANGDIPQVEVEAHGIGIRIREPLGTNVVQIVVPTGNAADYALQLGQTLIEAALDLQGQEQ